MTKAYLLHIFFKSFCNVPNFSGRQVSANSTDPDQTDPRSGSALFAVPSPLFGHITLQQIHIIQFVEGLQQCFRASEFLGYLCCCWQFLVLYVSFLHCLCVVCV